MALAVDVADEESLPLLRSIVLDEDQLEQKAAVGDNLDIEVLLASDSALEKLLELVKADIFE